MQLYAKESEDVFERMLSFFENVAGQISQFQISDKYSGSNLHCLQCLTLLVKRTKQQTIEQ